MIKTKVSSKGQIVIPKYLRDRWGFKRGTVLELAEHSPGQLIISKSLSGEPIEWAEWLKKARGLGKEIWEGVDPVKYTHDIWDDPDGS